MFAARTFDVAGLADLSAFNFKFSRPGRSAGRAHRGVTHDTALNPSHFGADGTVHMLHLSKVLVTAAV